MNSELLSILSNLAWSAIKDGVKLTYDVLYSKINQAINHSPNIDDCQKIADIIDQIPDMFKQNELLVQGYLQANSQLMEILKKLPESNGITVTQYSYGSGDNVGRDKIVSG